MKRTPQKPPNYDDPVEPLTSPTYLTVPLASEEQLKLPFTSAGRYRLILPDGTTIEAEIDAAANLTLKIRRGRST
jgi:hypothetical protein